MKFVPHTKSTPERAPECFSLSIATHILKTLFCQCSQKHDLLQGHLPALGIQCAQRDSLVRPVIITPAGDQQSMFLRSPSQPLATVHGILGIPALQAHRPISGQFVQHCSKNFSGPISFSPSPPRGCAQTGIPPEARIALTAIPAGMRLLSVGQLFKTSIMAVFMSSA